MWHVQMRFTISMHEIELKALNIGFFNLILCPFPFWLMDYCVQESASPWCGMICVTAINFN